MLIYGYWNRGHHGTDADEVKFLMSMCEERVQILRKTSVHAVLKLALNAQASLLFTFVSQEMPTKKHKLAVLCVKQLLTQTM